MEVHLFRGLLPIREVAGAVSGASPWCSSALFFVYVHFTRTFTLRPHSIPVVCTSSPVPFLPPRLPWAELFFFATNLNHAYIESQQILRSHDAS